MTWKELGFKVGCYKYEDFTPVEIVLIRSFSGLHSFCASDIIEFTEELGNRKSPVELMIGFFNNPRNVWELHEKT